MKKISGLAMVLALTVLALLGPAKTSEASPCTDLCYSENYYCKLDCRFTPYPGCLTDCANELQACLAAC